MLYPDLLVIRERILKFTAPKIYKVWNLKKQECNTQAYLKENQFYIFPGPDILENSSFKIYKLKINTANRSGSLIVDM